MLSFVKRLDRYWAAAGFVLAILGLMVFKSLEFLPACLYSVLVVGVVSVCSGFAHVFGDMYAYLNSAGSYKEVRSVSKGEKIDES